MTFSLQREVMPIETHPFEPFLPQGARILFLGSFPPQEKRWCMPFFYPNWINDFWRIMGLVHFGDKDHFCIRGEKRFDEAAIRAFCTKEGLAFYDTACAVRRLRDNASDAFLEVVTPTDIPALLRQIPDCNNLVTTGQKASEQVAAQFGCATPPVGGCIDIRPGSGANGPRTTHGVDLRPRRSPTLVRFWHPTAHLAGSLPDRGLEHPHNRQFLFIFSWNPARVASAPGVPGR